MRHVTNLEGQDRGETLPFFARVRNSSNEESSLGRHVGNYSMHYELMHVTRSASHTYSRCIRGPVLVISRIDELTERSGKERRKKTSDKTTYSPIQTPRFPRAQVEKCGSCIPANELHIQLGHRPQRISLPLTISLCLHDFMASLLPISLECFLFL